MKFRTEISPSVFPYRIEISDRIFSIGSCFAENIAAKLNRYKFRILSNPFGTLYNPASIKNALELAINGDQPASWSFLVNQEVHRNYYFHSTISSLDETDLRSTVTFRLQQTREAIEQTNWIIMTWGSAWVYRLKENGKIVGNCHKVPQHAFTKELLTTSEVIESFKGLYHSIKSVNSNCKFILTVSPVRHLNDSLELNAVSKSTLRLASHEITYAFNDVFYFPSYEIQLDDLRDYRFYAEDLTHPSQQAIDYIWEKFCQSQMSEDTLEFIDSWEKIRKSMDHRPFNKTNPQYLQHLEKTLQKVNRYKSLVDITDEVEILNKKIHEFRENAQQTN